MADRFFFFTAHILNGCKHAEWAICSSHVVTRGYLPDQLSAQIVELVALTKAGVTASGLNQHGFKIHFWCYS